MTAPPSKAAFRLQLNLERGQSQLALNSSIPCQTERWSPNEPDLDSNITSSSSTTSISKSSTLPKKPIEPTKSRMAHSIDVFKSGEEDDRLITYTIRLTDVYDLQELATYLKNNTRYSGILASIDVNTIHRGLLEALITRNNFETYIELCKFQQLDKIPFYKYGIAREEIEQILSCILHINAGNSEDFISTLPSYLISHTSFDMLQLAKSKNLHAK